MKVGTQVQVLVQTSQSYNYWPEPILNTSASNSLVNGQLKKKSSELLGLQAKFDTLQIQFQALAAEQAKLKAKLQPTTQCPDGAPEPEKNETHTVAGQMWYYCKICMSGHHWSKTHKTDKHRRGAGKTKDYDTDKKEKSKLAAYDTGYGSDADMKSG